MVVKAGSSIARLAAGVTLGVALDNVPLEIGIGLGIAASYTVPRS